MKYPYIAIEGNIGAGKTTLAKLLVEKLNAKLILEEFEDNPFLNKFYKQPDEYAFPLEMSFLADRYRQLNRCLNTSDIFKSQVIADYFLGKSLVFAQNNLRVNEYSLYRQFFDIVQSNLPQPDLIIYLQRSLVNLQSNIKKRGRSYEQAISSEYLEQIQSSYFAFFKQKPDLRIIILNVDNQNFNQNEEFVNKILELTETTFLKGLTIL